MATIIKTNTEQFLQHNQEKRREFIEDVALRMAQGELLFITDIKQKQMSGQRGSLGTNVITDMLRSKWFNTTIRQNQNVKAMVWSTTPYAPLHEEGGTFMVPAHGVKEHMRKSKNGVEYNVAAHIVMDHQVVFHKRLRIGEAWEQTFIPNMRKQIDASAAKYLR